MSTVSYLICKYQGVQPHHQIPANMRFTEGVMDFLSWALCCLYMDMHSRPQVCVKVGREEQGVTSYFKIQCEEWSTCGRTTESPQESVPHPRHIWWFKVSLSVSSAVCTSSEPWITGRSKLFLVFVLSRSDHLKVGIYGIDSIQISQMSSLPEMYIKMT